MANTSVFSGDLEVYLPYAEQEVEEDEKVDYLGSSTASTARILPPPPPPTRGQGQGHVTQGQGHSTRSTVPNGHVRCLFEQWKEPPHGYQCYFSEYYCTLLFLMDM